MSTLPAIFVHVIFSTKDRAPLISEEIESGMFAYMGGIAAERRSPILFVGAASDHVHLVTKLATTECVADLVMHVKKGSSRYMKAHEPSFAWQKGYGAFSVGASQLPALKRYVAGQREHHRTRSFKEEFVAFLEKYQVEYDERYIWE